MKHIKRYESFRTSEEEQVNEEFLGKLIGGIKNLFKKAQERINKVRGGKEIEAIFQKYMTVLHDQLSKGAQVDLNLAAAAKGEEAAPAKPAAKPGAPTAPGAEEEAQKESASYSGSEMVKEADDANAKLAVDTLKKKKAIMDQILAKTKEMAIKEMEKVLAKYGGAAGNPQLDAILQTKKDEFDMAYLNAQMAYLDAAGDKTMIAELTKKRDAVAKGIEAKMKDFDKLQPVEYKEGDEVIYLLKGKKKEEYNKAKKPEDQKAVVGVHKIVSIEGDKFTLEDEDGKPTIIKTGAEIVGKAAVDPAEQAAGEYKEGDSVIYKRDKWESNKGQEAWDKLSDEEKKNPNEGKLKDLIDNESVGIKTIKAVEKDFVRFTDVDWVKDNDEILGKTEAPKAEGQEELTKKLGDMKAKNPEGLKKISSYVDFISDEKNKDKVAEIEKIIGGGEAAEQK